MVKHREILLIGTIEILIGSVTVLGNFLTLALSLNTKSPTILGFVIIAGCLSTSIGLGLFKHQKWAYKLLLYFSSVIILSKVLIFLHVIVLNGELEMSLHKAFEFPVSESWRNGMNNLKSFISISYHGLIIVLLSKKNIKNHFLH